MPNTERKMPFGFWFLPKAVSMMKKHSFFGNESLFGRNQTKKGKNFIRYGNINLSGLLCFSLTRTEREGSQWRGRLTIPYYIVTVRIRGYYSGYLETNRFVVSIFLSA